MSAGRLTDTEREEALHELWKLRWIEASDFEAELRAQAPALCAPRLVALCAPTLVD